MKFPDRLDLGMMTIEHVGEYRLYAERVCEIKDCTEPGDPLCAAHQSDADAGEASLRDLERLEVAIVKTGDAIECRHLTADDHYSEVGAEYEGGA